MIAPPCFGGQPAVSMCLPPGTWSYRKWFSPAFLWIGLGVVGLTWWACLYVQVRRHNRCITASAIAPVHHSTPDPVHTCNSQLQGYFESSLPLAFQKDIMLCCLWVFAAVKIIRVCNRVVCCLAACCMGDDDVCVLSSACSECVGAWLVAQIAEELEATLREASTFMCRLTAWCCEIQLACRL
jgi:hypothetical protein